VVRIARLAGVLLAQVACCTIAMAEQPSRIHEHRISEGERFTVQGNVHPLVALGTDQGEADSALPLSRISLHFRLTAAQETDLDRLLKDQQDRSSPQYHKWLTLAQLTNRFGVSQSDMNKVVAWLENQGFTNVEPAPNRLAVSMSGNAALASNAFQVSLHRYLVNGRTHFANQDNPTLPKALQGMVAGIRGLNDFHPKMHKSVWGPRFTSSISNQHFIAPDDFATIYDLHTLYNSGIDGTGISIAIAGQTDIALSDIDAFRAAAGLPAKDPTVLLVGADPGTSSDDLGEADLDVELAGSVARNANIIYVNSNDAFTSLEYALNSNVAPVVSVSYGNCEAQSGGSISILENELKAANALGITIVAAAGDSGAADCDSSITTAVTSAKQGLAVDYPASSQYVTGVGGSEFTDAAATGATQYWSASNNASNGSATSYIPEQVWNDTTSQGSLSAGGGGASAQFAKPSWQQGTGVPNDGHRDVPDVSLTASPVVDSVLICSGGWCTNGFRNSGSFLDTTGGTSVGAPSFAGVVALLNQKTGGPVGNVNVMLYQLAGVSTNAFHDITTGGNIVPCTTGTPNCTTGSLGYSATAGYDQASGLGSVDGTNLVNDWPDFQMSLSSTALTLASGGSANVTVNVTRTPVFSAAVSFSCTSSVSTVTCSAPGQITNSGSGTLTVSRASSGLLVPHSLPVHWNQGGLWWLALGGVSLTVFFTARRRREFLWTGVVGASLCLAGCGGGSSSTSVAQTVAPTPTSATITLTATSGVLPQTATITVTLD
jgi:subtilase family serine protease